MVYLDFENVMWKNGKQIQPKPKCWCVSWVGRKMWDIRWLFEGGSSLPDLKRSTVLGNINSRQGFRALHHNVSLWKDYRCKEDKVTSFLGLWFYSIFQRASLSATTSEAHLQRGKDWCTTVLAWVSIQDRGFSCRSCSQETWVQITTIF